MPELEAAAWAMLAVGAMMAGFSKTGINGAGLLTVGLFAAVLPAKASTGLVLLVFLTADVFGVLSYRAHADWPTLRRLAPAVVVGILVGVVFLIYVDDTGLRRTIGAVLLLLVAVHLWFRKRSGDGGARVLPRPVTVAAGTGAGFTTMVANSGGAVMSVYLLGARLPMLTFLGTTVWFFFLVNLFKTPFSIALGLIDATSLMTALALVPAVVVGAVLGRLLIKRIQQPTFEWLVLASTVLAGLNLLLR